MKYGTRSLLSLHLRFAICGPRLSSALALLVTHRLSPVTSEIREIQIASLELQLAESTMAQRVLVAAAILGTGSGSGAAFASNFLSEEG
jgi:hypothetical protein